MADASVGASVEIGVVGGPDRGVSWTAGMTVRQALERTYEAFGRSPLFTFGLRYFGHELGHLVCMINDTYGTLRSTAEPYFYWELLVNGLPAPLGVDRMCLAPGDAVAFRLMLYDGDAYEAAMRAGLQGR